MEKCFWLIPEKLGGRPGPDAEPWDAAALREGGIGAILSVNNGSKCDSEALANAGIAHLCVPLSDKAPPESGDLEHCIRALPKAYDFVAAQLGDGRKVVVHCSGGKDRTGLFLSYFLVVTNKLPIDDAINSVRQVRPIALSAEGWEDFAHRVLEHFVEQKSTQTSDC